jgi:hypothetical protein
MSDALMIEVLDAADRLMAGIDFSKIDRGNLERLLSLAYLEGRKSGLEAAQAVYSPLAS